MWYMRTEDKALSEKEKLQLKLQDEIAISAALGLPVPEIRRETAPLDESDIAVDTNERNHKQTVLARDRNSAESKDREVIRGAGSGPIRELDVISEVCFEPFHDGQNLITKPYSQPTEPTTRGANVVVLTPQADLPISPITFNKEDNPVQEEKKEETEGKETEKRRHRHRHVQPFQIRQAQTEEGRNHRHHHHHRRHHSRSRSRSRSQSVQPILNRFAVSSATLFS